MGTPTSEGRVVYLTDEEVVALLSVLGPDHFPALAREDDSIGRAEVDAGLRSLVVRGLFEPRDDGRHAFEPVLAAIVDLTFAANEYSTITWWRSGGRCESISWYVAGEHAVIHAVVDAGLHSIALTHIHHARASYQDVRRSLSPPTAQPSDATWQFDELLASMNELLDGRSADSPGDSGAPLAAVVSTVEWSSGAELIASLAVITDQGHVWTIDELAAGATARVSPGLARPTVLAELVR